MLREFVLWWARQMVAFVPKSLLASANRDGTLFASLEDSGENRHLHLAIRRKRQEDSIGSFSLDATGLRAAAGALRQRPGRVVLRVPPETLLERSVVLPLAAERDIDRVVTYDMDRLTPFSADEVFWSCEVEHRDRAAGRLQARLSLVPRAALQALISALSQMGLRANTIETLAGGDTRRQIPCDDARPARPGRRATAFAAVVTGALAVAAIVTPFAMQSIVRADVDARVEALQPQAAEAAALRRRIASATSGADAIAAERARTADTLQVLAAVTDILPDDTVLSDFSLNQGKLGIGGQSVAAAGLIPALAAHPMIRNPSFAAPVTRTQDGRADAFVIRAEFGP
jgi:general secretion pathway protein L